MIYSATKILSGPTTTQQSPDGATNASWRLSASIPLAERSILVGAALVRDASLISTSFLHLQDNSGTFMRSRLLYMHDRAEPWRWTASIVENSFETSQCPHLREENSRLSAGLTRNDSAQFDDHCSWHSQCQFLLRRPQHRQYRWTIQDDVLAPSAQGDSPSSMPVRSPCHLPTSRASALSSPENAILDSAILPSVRGLSFDSTASPSISSNSISRPGSTIICGIRDVVSRFPTFTACKTEPMTTTRPGLECADCHAVFFTPEDCLSHRESHFCPGSPGIAYTLSRDATQPGGYRLQRRLLPFELSASFVKCRKCNSSFPTLEETDVHEKSHVTGHLECVHCLRIFDTSTELGIHHDWHDDMEFRHLRDKSRVKRPGLKLQSQQMQSDESGQGLLMSQHSSAFVADRTLMPGVGDHLAAVGLESEFPETGSTPKRRLVSAATETTDGLDDLVAVSFISPEDLERVHAPNGIFRDLEADFLSVYPRSNMSPVLPASEACDVRSTTSDFSSQRSKGSLDLKMEITLQPDSPHKKRLNPRGFLRKGRMKPFCKFLISRPESIVQRAVSSQDSSYLAPSRDHR